MKKAALIITRTAALCAFTSCSQKESVSSNTSSAAFNEAAAAAHDKTETITVRPTEKADTTATEAVTENNTEGTAPTETASANADTTTEFTDLSGYWYADGDPDSNFFHITENGEFKVYYGLYGATLSYKGYVKRELDPETNNYIYRMYQDSGELYQSFAYDGSNGKTDITIINGDDSRYVKLYGENENVTEKSFTGSWNCGRAIIEIHYNDEGELYAQVAWSGSASSHLLWQYPVTFENGKLICSGKGSKYLSEFINEDPNNYSETTEYTDGSAEFSIEGNRLYWNDFKEHSAEKMLFSRVSY